MFDKNAQRARAQEFELAQLSKGVQKPPALPAPVTPKFFSVSAKPVVKVKAEPKAKKIGYLIEPFTNEFGQVIQPGDKIIAVAQGYQHSIKVRNGIYLGLRRDQNGKVSSVSIRYKVKDTKYVNAKGNTCSWRDQDAEAISFSREVGTSLPSKRIYPTV
jgi:Tfp pilus assembly protein PilP